MRVDSNIGKENKMGMGQRIKNAVHTNDLHPGRSGPTLSHLVFMTSGKNIETLHFTDELTEAHWLNNFSQPDTGPSIWAQILIKV